MCAGTDTENEPEEARILGRNWRERFRDAEAEIQKFN